MHNDRQIKVRKPVIDQFISSKILNNRGTDLKISCKGSLRHISDVATREGRMSREAHVRFNFRDRLSIIDAQIMTVTLFSSPVVIVILK